MSTPVPVVTDAPNPPETPKDDLGIDRAFLLQMAQVPPISLLLIAFSWISHLVWAGFAEDVAVKNLGPLVVVSLGMIVAAVIDGWAFKVPNWLTLSLVLSGWGLGILHEFGVPIDAGEGGIGSAFLGTMLGFILLYPMLMINGMGQGDVKMQMGFGAWIGAFFGFRDGANIILVSFVIGALVGGVFGLIMMILRRQFQNNADNFGEIATDLRILVTYGPATAARRAGERKPRWVRLPYGVPLCIGFLGYLWLWVIPQLGAK